MRLTALSVALLVSVSLAGCGSSKKSRSNASTVAPSTSSSSSANSSGTQPTSTTAGTTSAAAGGTVSSPTMGGTVAPSATNPGTTPGSVGTTAPGSTVAPGAPAPGAPGTPGTPTTPGTPGTPTTPGAPTTPTTPPVAPTGPDVSPPLITLTSPNRGTFTTQQAIVVEGTITDQTGVAYFVINGTPVTPGPTGAFRTTVALTSGLNVVEIQAADPLAHSVQTSLSVISGEFLPEASVVADAVATRMNRPVFDTIERVAAQQLGGMNLGTTIMAANPLFSGGSGLANVAVDATAASFGTPVLDLDPRAGGLYVKAEIPMVDVTVRAHGRLVGIPYSVTTNVTADVARVEALATVTINAGVVTTTLTQVNVDLDNFRFDINNVPGFLERLARNAVRGLIERMVRQQVETIVPAEINKAIAGANGPITQMVMGRPVTLHVIPTAVTFDPDGALVTANADMTMQPLPGVVLPTTPGSLKTPGAFPTFGTQRAIAISANDDLLNRIGHAAWRGGLLNMKIDQAFLAQQSLPAWLHLDAFLLQIFFPQLQGLLNPTDPLEIEIGSLTPPIFQTKPAPGLIGAAIGDLTISIYVAPAGAPRQLVLQASLQVALDVNPQVTNGRLMVSMNGRPTFKTDVHQTPIAPLNQIAVENLIDFVFPPVIQILVGNWSGFPLPTHPAIQPSNVDVLRDGPNLDFLTIRGDL
jgi:hypothetical protein